MFGRDWKHLANIKQPNKALHRIAARVRFEVNMNGLGLGGKRCA